MPKTFWLDDASLGWQGLNKILTRSLIFDLLKRFIIKTDEALLDRTQFWPSEKITALQFYRAKRVIKNAYRFVPFWKSHLARNNLTPGNLKNLNDFSKIPVVSKLDFKSAPFDFLLNKDLSIRDCFLDSTSGSTGNPLTFYIDHNYILRSFAFCRRIFKWAGMQKKDKVARLVIRDRQGFSLDYVSLFARFPEDHEKRFWDLLFLSEKLGKDQKIMLFSFGSIILRLVDFVKKNNLKLNLRSVIYSGESLSLAERRLISETFGVSVFNCYAGRETGWLAQECERGGMHLNPEWAYLEITDAEGRPVSRGVDGRIVVTTFDNEIMPFIRYDTGDSGRILNGCCSCGRTLPLLEFRGREIERLYLPDDRVMDFGEFAFLFEKWAVEIESFQIVQESLYMIKVNLVLASRKSFEESVLLIALKKFLGDKVLVKINPVNEIPLVNNKRKIFVSRI